MKQCCFLFTPRGVQQNILIHSCRKRKLHSGIQVKWSGQDGSPHVNNYITPQKQVTQHPRKDRSVTMNFTAKLRARRFFPPHNFSFFLQIIFSWLWGQTFFKILGDFWLFCGQYVCTQIRENQQRLNNGNLCRHSEICYHSKDSTVIRAKTPTTTRSPISSISLDSGKEEVLLNRNNREARPSAVSSSMQRTAYVISTARNKR